MVELTKTDINKIVDGLYKSIKEKEGKRPASTKAQIKKDLEELCRHPKLKDITYKRGTLRFYTTELLIKLDKDPLYAPHILGWYKQNPNKKLADFTILGEFEIVQYIKSKRTRIYNLTNNKHEWHHPHILSGVPCFHQFAKIKNNLVRRLELVGYIELIFQFLDSYEPEHTPAALLWLEPN